MLSREELLGGLPARRASTLLFAIEGYTARLVNESRQAATHYRSEKTAEARERALLEALAAGRRLPIQPTIQDLERYAPAWEVLVPPDPRLRAALARLLGEKYRFTAAVTPALHGAVGLDDAAVQQAYQHRYGRPLVAIYAPRLAAGDQVRWLRARLGGWIEHLPPFWTVFGLVLSQTVGTGILALPIALAGIGALPGVALLGVFGVLSLLTISAYAEAVARNGAIRYGTTYLGRLVTDLLGPAGSSFLALSAPALILFTIICYTGLASTLAGATGIPPTVWAAVTFLVSLYFLRGLSISSTIPTTMLLTAINIVLILVLSALALTHLHVANLLRVDLPFTQGRPFRPALLALAFGVVLDCYYGHQALSDCAKVVLRRDPTGRALLWGAAAAIGVATLLYAVWVTAVSGAIAPAVLVRQEGTALVPLATAIGPPAALVGMVYVVLSLGLNAVHASLALVLQAREWLAPARSPAPPEAAAGRPGRREAARTALAFAPAVAVFAVAEGVLLTGHDLFAGALALLGTLEAALVTGIMPVLMLATSRRRGEYVPGTVLRFLGHPALLAGLYVFFVAGILLHGLVIWQNPLQRTAALLTGAVILLTTSVILRRGAFRPRTIIELSVDKRVGGDVRLSLVGHGRALRASIHLRYRAMEERVEASQVTVTSLHALRTASVTLPAAAPREVKVWAHQVTPEGDSVPLPALLTVCDPGGHTAPPHDLGATGGQVVLPAVAADVPLELSLLQEPHTPEERGR